MSLSKSELHHTVEEYLTMERLSEERHEFLDGSIYAMAGESLEHGAICTNIVGQLYSQLRATPCQLFSKDMKVRSGPVLNTRRQIRGLFSYPDIVVVCGEPQFHDEHRDVLVNPRAIIEVLSPSTEAFDRGSKFLRYRTHLSSLTDYLVVAQDSPFIEHFAIQPNGQWVIALSVISITESVKIPSINCLLRLSDVYDRIVFPVFEDEELSPN